MPLYQWRVSEDLTIRADLPTEIAQIYNRAIDAPAVQEPDLIIHNHVYEVFVQLMQLHLGDFNMMAVKAKYITLVPEKYQIV